MDENLKEKLGCEDLPNVIKTCETRITHLFIYIVRCINNNTYACILSSIPSVGYFLMGIHSVVDNNYKKIMCLYKNTGSHAYAFILAI